MLAVQKPVLEHRVTFPPFPSPPVNVSIISFKDFKENGIKVQEDDYEGPEVDSLGIPTIRISKRHIGDFCKTNSQSAKHDVIEADTSKTAGLSQPRTWVQEWEILSTTKSGEFYNKNDDPTSRLHQATHAFNANRTWPKGERNKLVRNQWDQFQVYIGTLCTQGSNKIGENDVDNDDDKIEEEEEDEAVDTITRELDGNSPQTTVIVSTERLIEPKKNRPQQPENDHQNVHSQEIERDELDRSGYFLKDPAKSVQVYLSSYMMEKGFHYDDRNLTLTPTLIGFYIEFLIQDGVFSITAESQTIAALKKALAVAHLAKVELPLTSQISRRLPWNDKFIGGCIELFNINDLVRAQRWGQQDQIDQTLGVDPGPERELVPIAAAIPAPGDSLKLLELGEEDCVDIPAEQLHDAHQELDQVELDRPPESVFEQLHDEPQELDQEMHCLPESAVSVLTNNGEPDVWDSTNLKDDHMPDDSLGWGARNIATDLSWDDNETDDDSWGSPLTPTLFPILGPTALPLTHTSGVVEWSMRRIQSISHPESHAATAVPSMTPDGALAETMVEADLCSRLSKVVMEPWLDWDTSSGVSSPRIKASSRGRVVVYEKGEGVEYEHNSDIQSNSFVKFPASDEPMVSPHDPLKHSITLLLEPESAQLLKTGMGLGANWVQIARRSDLVDDLEEMLGEKDAEKIISIRECLTQQGDHAERFWYLSNLLVIIPSFHTVGGRETHR
ncbi:hypothetical protein F5880DRAFT_563391 [Lentinula raphanica]|nr:hypothetical protein F5880DRAFT_563391 [Lentinula raphanica]